MSCCKIYSWKPHPGLTTIMTRLQAPTQAGDTLQRADSRGFAAISSLRVRAACTWASSPHVICCR